MSLKWTDTHAIAIALDEAHPEVDPLTVRFTELMEWCLELSEFEDHADHCGEKILEAIQMTWIEEKD